MKLAILIFSILIIIVASIDFYIAGDMEEDEMYIIRIVSALAILIALIAIIIIL